MGLAADRGVTICFADLDGADGLWVPEERTILVSRALPEDRVNEVIEHELAHVAIDDQHAELDAGVFRPPPGPLQTLLAKRWATPALSAAAFLALVGGATVGLAAALPDGPTRQVVNPAPGPTEDPVTGPQPTTTVIRTVDASGNPIVVTVTVTPSRAGTPVPTPTPSAATPTSPAPTSRGPGTEAPGRSAPRTSSPTPVVTTPPVTTTPAPVVTTTPPVTTEPPPTTPAGDAITDVAGDASTVTGPGELTAGPTS